MSEPASVLVAVSAGWALTITELLTASVNAFFLLASEEVSEKWLVPKTMTCERPQYRVNVTLGRRPAGSVSMCGVDHNPLRRLTRTDVVGPR